MKDLRFILSTQEPAVRDCVWCKPVEGGFALYMLQAGVMTPLKVMDDKSTASIVDDAVQDLVGSVQDEKTANTINGAKAYANYAAEAVGAEIVGESTDAASNMTLYGLKAYIDSQIESLG